MTTKRKTMPGASRTTANGNRKTGPTKLERTRSAMLMVGHAIRQLQAALALAGDDISEQIGEVAERTLMNNWLDVFDALARAYGNALLDEEADRFADQ